MFTREGDVTSVGRRKRQRPMKVSKTKSSCDWKSFRSSKSVCSGPGRNKRVYINSVSDVEDSQRCSLSDPVAGSDDASGRLPDDDMLFLRWGETLSQAYSGLDVDGSGVVDRSGGSEGTSLVAACDTVRERNELVRSVLQEQCVCSCHRDGKDIKYPEVGSLEVCVRCDCFDRWCVLFLENFLKTNETSVCTGFFLLRSIVLRRSRSRMIFLGCVICHDRHPDIYIYMGSALCLVHAKALACEAFCFQELHFVQYI